METIPELAVLVTIAEPVPVRKPIPVTMLPPLVAHNDSLRMDIDILPVVLDMSNEILGNVEDVKMLQWMFNRWYRRQYGSVAPAIYGATFNPYAALVMNQCGCLSVKKSQGLAATRTPRALGLLA